MAYADNLLHIIIRCESCGRIYIDVIIPVIWKCIKILILSYVLEIRVLIYKINSFFVKACTSFSVNIPGIFAIRTGIYIIKIISRLTNWSQGRYSFFMKCLKCSSQFISSRVRWTSVYAGSGIFNRHIYDIRINICYRWTSGNSFIITVSLNMSVGCADIIIYSHYWVILGIS